MKQFFKTLLLMIGLFLLSQLPSLALGIVLGYNQSLGIERFSLVQTASMTTCYLMTLALIVYIARHKGIFTPLCGSRTRRIWLTFIIAYVIVYCGATLSNWVLQLEGHTNTVNQTELEQLVPLLPTALFFVIVVIVAPITEEIIFRGFAAKCLFPNKEWLGLLIGSLLFALVHQPTNIGSALIYGILSAVLAFIYWRTKDIKYSIVFHAINNIIVFLAMVLSVM